LTQSKFTQTGSRKESSVSCSTDGFRLFKLYSDAKPPE